MILITGPGRSGTTFLVQLLTRLGLDTGYEPYKEPYKEPYIEQIRAGCEKRLPFDWEWPDEYLREKFATLPRVVKGPDWSFVIKELARREIVDFECVLMPLRDLGEAARSRIGVGLYWNALKTDDEETQLRDQAVVLTVAVGAVVEACVLYDIPLALMHFPKIVQEDSYLYEQLKELPTFWNAFSWEEFERVFGELARPEQVHQWTLCDQKLT